MFHSVSAACIEHSVSAAYIEQNKTTWFGLQMIGHHQALTARMQKGKISQLYFGFQISTFASENIRIV